MPKPTWLKRPSNTPTALFSPLMTQVTSQRSRHTLLIQVTLWLHLRCPLLISRVSLSTSITCCRAIWVARIPGRSLTLRTNWILGGRTDRELMDCSLWITCRCRICRVEHLRRWKLAILHRSLSLSRFFCCTNVPLTPRKYLTARSTSSFGSFEFLSARSMART